MSSTNQPKLQTQRVNLATRVFVPLKHLDIRHRKTGDACGSPRGLKLWKVLPDLEGWVLQRPAWEQYIPSTGAAFFYVLEDRIRLGESATVADDVGH